MAKLKKVGHLERLERLFATMLNARDKCARTVPYQVARKLHGETKIFWKEFFLVELCCVAAPACARCASARERSLNLFLLCCYRAESSQGLPVRRGKLIPLGRAGVLCWAGCRLWGDFAQFKTERWKVLTQSECCRVQRGIVLLCGAVLLRAAEKEHFSEEFFSFLGLVC